METTQICKLLKARFPPTRPVPGAGLRLDSPPSETAIALLAYEKFAGRGCQHGFDQEDWFAAERELTAISHAAVAQA